MGWHVPSSAEWVALSNCLGGSAVAGAAMKETGTAHWVAPNAGATNSSGFTGLPGGFRYGTAAGGLTGTSANMFHEAYWWSSTELSPVNVTVDVLIFNTNANDPYMAPKTFGFSVRLVKN